MNNDEAIEEIAKRAILQGAGHFKIVPVDPYGLSWWDRNGTLIAALAVSFGSGFVGFILGRLTS